MDKPINREAMDLAFETYKDIGKAIDALESIGVMIEDGRGIGGDLYSAQTKAVDIMASLLGIDMATDGISEKAYALISGAAGNKYHDIRGIPDKALSALEKLACRKDDGPNGKAKASSLTPEQIEGYRDDMGYVLDRLLSDSCMVTSINLTDAVRRGLYLIMSVYGLGIRSCARADWEWVELCEDGKSPALNAEAIKKRAFDEEKFLSACAALKAKQDGAPGPDPGPDPDQDPDRNPDPGDDAPRFGWLSPSGDFTPSPFGSHDDSAEEIIKARGWMDEFCEWDVSDQWRDFLINAKGYALLHNPGGNQFDPFVTSGEMPLTSAQNIFLHDYYIGIGNVVRAALYE